MNPGKGDVHVNAALTNLALGYHPQGLIARSIFPVIPVAKESDKYYVWNKQDAFARPSTLRADGAEANEVGFRLSTDTYQCEEYALKTAVTDRQMKNADSVLNLKTSKMRRLQDLLELDLEVRVATMLTTLGTWASTNRVTLSGADQFDNASFTASGVPIEKRFDTAKEAVRQGTGGYEPNVVIIPSAVAKVMKRDSAIRDLIKYTHSDLLVDGDLPQKLWGMKVVIPKATYTSSKEGASSVTYSDVWGKHIVFLYVNPNAVIDDISAGYIFQSQNWETREWREEKNRKDVVETSYVQDEKVVSNIAGYLMKDVIA